MHFAVFYKAKTLTYSSFFQQKLFKPLLSSSKYSIQKNNLQCNCIFRQITLYFRSFKLSAILDSNSNTLTYKKARSRRIDSPLPYLFFYVLINCVNCCVLKCSAYFSVYHGTVRHHTACLIVCVDMSRVIGMSFINKCTYRKRQQAV